MTGTVKHARLESATARSRLPKRGRQPHWQALQEGKLHLGWQCWRGDPCGRWVLRRYVGKKYRQVGLGLADDVQAADGHNVLSYAQAKAKAVAMEAVPTTKNPKLTVRQAVTLYIEHLTQLGKLSAAKETAERAAVHIYPRLGNRVVAQLEAKDLRQWLAVIADTPAQKRSKRDEPQYRQAPTSEEQIRARRNSANRVATILRAALNHAYHEEHVANDGAWGRKFKLFRNVAAARVRYLSIAEAQRLFNAAAPDFKPLVRAALETGCRYGELIRLEVRDYNADAGTVLISKSKTGKTRHVVLTPEGAEFFRTHCAGRTGNDLMFKHRDGSPWRRSQQWLPMQTACEHALLVPACGFHQLRHTWASLAVQANVPMMVVAKNLGHSNTRMLEKHYGHLAPSLVADAIRVGAPRYGIATDTSVTSLRTRRRG
jgi:integrase